ncbi:MAG TPA: hypothetical protein VH518_18425 [Tepidisphaeraceae bacterium]
MSKLTVPPENWMVPLPVNLAPVITRVPPANRSTEPGDAENVPLSFPPAFSDTTPLLTETVPALLNGMFIITWPVPTVRVNVPVLKKAFAPPKFSNVLSA